MKYELPSTELIVTEENNYLKFGEYLNDMQCDDTTNKLCLDDLEYVKKLQQENKQLQERIKYLERSNNRREDTILEQRQEISDLEDNWNKLKHKLSKIETLVINHNCDTGDIYYKYNSKFLKSELKQRILEIVYEQGSDE